MQNVCLNNHKKGKLCGNLVNVLVSMEKINTCADKIILLRNKMTEKKIGCNNICYSKKNKLNKTLTKGTIKFRKLYIYYTQFFHK